MNISSAVIRVKGEFKNEVLAFVSTIPACEVHIHEEDKIIITIEADNVNGEIAVIRKLEGFKHILNVEMVYAYSEDELEQERDKLEFANDTPEVLNNESISASDINYRGDLKKKF